MADSDETKSKQRCPDCKGTGLVDTEIGTTCCDCPVGRIRKAAESGLDFMD